MPLSPVSSSREMGCAQVLSRGCLFATPCTVGRRNSLSLGFPMQQYWSGVPFPTPGGLPNPGIEPTCLVSPAIAGRMFTNRPIREAQKLMNPKLDFIHDPTVVSISPRDGILINMSGITNKVICFISPAYPPEEEKAICMKKTNKKPPPFPCSGIIQSPTS